MNNKIVTVITAVYNGEKFIEGNIKSVINQTIPCTHILIDDKSVDKSLEFLSNWKKKHKHIEIITHNANKGYPTALNSGIFASNTKYIAILDVDDTALPNWLESTISILEKNSSIGAVGGGCIIMNESGETTGYVKYCDYVGDVTKIIQDGGYPILHPGTVYRKKYIEKIGGYNPEMKSFEDSDLFLTLSFFCKIYSLGIPVINYRRLTGSESRKTLEYTNQINSILELKSSLLRTETSIQEINNKVSYEVEKLKKIPRLIKLEKKIYTKEMATSFEKGGRRIRAAQEYLILLKYNNNKNEIYDILLSIARCLTPYWVLFLYRKIRYDIYDIK